MPHRPTQTVPTRAHAPAASLKQQERRLGQQKQPDYASSEIATSWVGVGKEKEKAAARIMISRQLEEEEEEEEEEDNNIEDATLSGEGFAVAKGGGSVKRNFEDMLLQFRKPKKKKSLRKRREKLDAVEAEAISVEQEADDIVFGEEYEEEVLERWKLAPEKRKEGSAAVTGPQAAVALMAAIANYKTRTSATVGLQGNKVVITEMEFVLSSHLYEEDYIPKSVRHEIEPEIASEEREAEVIAPPADDVMRESAVGKGLSGALKLLRERGALKEDIDMENRKKKEEFRRFCHIFHGTRPGKKKRERRMKQQEAYLKSKQKYLLFQ